MEFGVREAAARRCDAVALAARLYAAGYALWDHGMRRLTLADVRDVLAPASLAADDSHTVWFVLDSWVAERNFTIVGKGGLRVLGVHAY